MDKIKIGGSKPHFGNNQFRLNGGLKKDNDYQCAAWLQFRTGKGEDGRQLPQTNEQRAAIQEAYQTLLDLALKHGNGQLQLSLSIKEKGEPGGVWPVLERPLLFLDIPQDLRQNYSRPNFGDDNDDSKTDRPQF